ncbi:MAG: response regulator [candidate division KSB1 bacterium]|nr:response regulator [candidate division KSB1 bacterium]
MQQGQKNILVVNDEKDMLDQIQRWLDVAGYLVKCTPSAEDGVKLFGKNHFDLVLLDYNLKAEKAGARTAKTYIPMFKKINPAIPIVIVSATESELDQKELGVAEVIILHPAIWKSLPQRIQGILSKQ